MFVYQGQLVWFEWQSPHARMKSTRVWGLSHEGSRVVGGFVWLWPYGTSWIAGRVLPPQSATSVSTAPAGTGLE